MLNMTDTLLKEAERRAYQDLAQIDAEQANVKVLPKPRTITQVSAERRAEKELEIGAPKTGYPDLDLLIKGFIPGHLYTLTGVENVGKTSLACNFAIRVSRQGKKVLYFALEPENTVVDYLASVRCDKKFGELTPEDIEFDDNTIHIYGKQEISTIVDLVETVRQSERYDLIIIDHIGYFIHGEKDWIQEQSNAVKSLVGLAKERGCAIMLIAHLRKRGPGQKKGYNPTNDDISGSGAFKQDSTEVLIVTRNLISDSKDEVEYAEDGCLYVSKTKCGPNGKIKLTFSDRKANIVSWGEKQAKNEEERIRTLMAMGPDPEQLTGDF